MKVYPTTYLVSHDRKVIWRSTGFDESRFGELRAEIEKLGVK